MSASEAFSAYEAVRDVLPDVQRRGHCLPCESLEDIADQFDVFLLDAFGVLNIGETAIPGVCARVQGLIDAGKRVMVVSNAASVPLNALVEKYQRLGYPFGPADIVTSRQTLAAALAREPDRAWGVMGGDTAGLDDLGAQRLTGLLDDAETYAAVEGFLLVGSGGWSERRQRLLECALAARPRPVLVGNPDIVAPRESGFSIEPGFYAHRLAKATGTVPRFYGKPYDSIYALALERLGAIDRSRVVMVGDSLHTDILGAQVAGVASALISGYGFFAGSDVGAAVAASGIAPDFVLERP